MLAHLTEFRKTFENVSYQPSHFWHLHYAHKENISLKLHDYFTFAEQRNIDFNGDLLSLSYET